MPVIDEQEAAFFERPVRTQVTNAPHSCGCERHFPNMLWRQSGLERLPSTFLHLRGGSRGTHGAFCGSAADSSGPRRAFCGSGAGLRGHFEPAAAPGPAREAISSQLRLGARLSGHFEAAAAPGQARSAIFKRPCGCERARAAISSIKTYNSPIATWPHSHIARSLT